MQNKIEICKHMVYYIYIYIIFGRWPPCYFIFRVLSASSFTHLGLMCDSSHVAQTTFSHDSTAPSWCLKYKHGRLRRYLASVVSGGEKGRLHAALHEIGPNDRAAIRLVPGCDSRDVTRFLQSRFNGESNQRDTRPTITERRRCLSDGPNVTHLRAAPCVRDRRGTRRDSEGPPGGLIPYRDRGGNWLDSPRHVAAQPPLSRRSSREPLTGFSWPTFTALHRDVSVYNVGYGFVYSLHVSARP